MFGVSYDRERLNRPFCPNGINTITSPAMGRVVQGLNMSTALGRKKKKTRSNTAVEVEHRCIAEVEALIPSLPADFALHGIA